MTPVDVVDASDVLVVIVTTTVVVLDVVLVFDGIVFVDNMDAEGDAFDDDLLELLLDACELVFDA